MGILIFSNKKLYFFLIGKPSSSQVYREKKGCKTANRMTGSNELDYLTQHMKLVLPRQLLYKHPSILIYLLL